MQLNDVQLARRNRYLRNKNLNDDKTEAARLQLDPLAFIEGLCVVLENIQDCEIEELPRWRLMSDIYFNLLKKCMPDMRSIEVNVNKAAPGERAAVFNTYIAKRVG